jgi:hypothetical protein
MHKRMKLLLTALIAVFACSLPAGSASANRSIEVRGGPQVQAHARLRFLGTEGAASTEILCDITLLRTITSRIPKIPGTLFGKVTGILINRGGTTRCPACGHGSFIREVHDIVPLECTHSEAGDGILRWNCSRARPELWKLIYLSFQGTLPRITGINFRIRGIKFNLVLLEPFGGTLECLYEGEGHGLIVVNADSTITRARAVRELTSLRRVSGRGFGCPAAGTFEGEFRVLPTLTIVLV